MNLILVLAACHGADPTDPSRTDDTAPPPPAPHTGSSGDTGDSATGSGSTADTGPAPPSGPAWFVEHALADRELSDPAIADLDGDGRPELLAWDRVTRTVVVTWAGVTDPPLDLLGGADAFAVGDADGDGDPDLFLVSVVDDRVWWAENDGGGAFPTTHVIDDALPIDVVAQLWAADFDADGRTDLWVAEPYYAGSRGMRPYWNDPGGFVAGANPCPSCLTTGDYRLLIDDPDTDGDLDAFVYGSELNLLTNRGDRTFAVGPDLTRDPFYELVQLLGLEDVDADGLLDLLWTKNGAGLWSRAQGGGAYAEARPLALTGGDVAYANLGTLVDLDGDGRDDVAYTSSSSLAAADGTAAGLGAPRVTGRGLYVPTALVAGDADGDADADLVVAAWGGWSWFENVGPDTDGDGLADEVEVGLGTDAGAADTDGDGVSDVDEGGAGTDPTRGDTDGDGVSDGLDACAGADDAADADLDGLPDDCEPPSLALAWTSVSGLPFQSVTSALATADLDGDGDLDLLSAKAEVAWHENLGGLAFAAARPLSPSTDVEDLDLADLDGDGALDLVAAEPSLDQATVFALDAGAVRASAPVHLSVVEAVELADLDQSGTPDLVWWDGFDALWLATNDGGPAFTASVRIAALSSYGIAARQVDVVELEPGAPVVLVAGGLVAAVSPHGPGWVPIVVDAPSRSADRVAVADVDGDGRTDVAYAAQEVAVVRSVPNGSALPTTVAPLGRDHADVLAAADLDADGDPDLVWGGAGLPLTVAMNRGGVFDAPRALDPAVADVVDLEVADLDDDGVPELVVHVALANYAGEVRVYALR